MEGIGCAVPSILWDAFEEALQTNMYRLVKDIATTLGQPHQPLLEAIKAKKVKPYLVDTSYTQESDAVCDYICQRPDAMAVLQPCGPPVLWGAGPSRCPQHMYMTQSTSNLPLLKALTPVEQIPLYMSEDGSVYDGNFKLQGRMNGNTLTLFDVE